MKMNLTKMMVAVVVSSFATATLADDYNTKGMSDMNMQLMPQQFVLDAANTDMKEVRLAHMALEKSNNQDVKKFADKMIRDHSKDCEKVQQLAMKEGLNCPDTNEMAWNGNNNWNTNNYGNTNNWNANESSTGINTNSPFTQSSAGIGHQNYKGAEVMELGNQSMTNDEMNAGMELEMLSGTAFDQAYADKMVKGHEKAIAEYENASMNLSDSTLKKYAKKTLPTLREHLRMAQNLENKVGVWSGNTNSMSNANMNQ